MRGRSSPRSIGTGASPRSCARGVRGRGRRDPTGSDRDTCRTNWPALLYLANWMSLPDRGSAHLDARRGGAVLHGLASGPVLSRRWRYGPRHCARWDGGVARVQAVLFDGGAGSSRIYVGSDTEAWARCRDAWWPCSRITVFLPRVRGLPWSQLSACSASVWSSRRRRRPGWLSRCRAGTAALLIWVNLLDPEPTAGGTALRYVGCRSYALYLWHPACLMIAVLALGPSVAAVALGLSLAVMAPRLVAVRGESVPLTESAGDRTVWSRSTRTSSSSRTSAAGVDRRVGACAERCRGHLTGAVGSAAGRRSDSSRGAGRAGRSRRTSTGACQGRGVVEQAVEPSVVRRRLSAPTRIAASLVSAYRHQLASRSRVCRAVSSLRAWPRACHTASGTVAGTWTPSRRSNARI
jgi:hypothetical protein